MFCLLKEISIHTICACLHGCNFLLCRVENLTEEDIFSVSEDHMILKPLKFNGHVTRLLSGWCKEIPAIDVGADLEEVEVINFFC